MNLLKKSFPMLLLLLCCVIIGVVLSSAIFAFTGFSIFGKNRDVSSAPADVNNSAELTALAYKVLEYIKCGDFESLSNTAHPEFGVVFSPCATVTLSTNRCFRPEQIAVFGDDSNVYVWGVRNGSGEPIEMTPSDYFASFVFDKDYTAAGVIGVNHVVKSGNALENIAEVFNDVRFVDFHMSGAGRDSPDDLGWSSLRLGFEEYGGVLMLTVILNSRWTE